MKALGKIALIALALGAAAGVSAQPAGGAKPAPAATPATNWVKHTSSEAKFTVSFPSKPKESQREDKTPDGRAVVTHFQSVDDGKQYFATSWVLMPATPRDKQARDRVLDSASEGALKSVAGGTLVSKKKITLGKAAGLDYVIDVPKDSQRLRQRVFLVGDKLVQQTYSGPKGSETGASVKQFVDSLKFQP